MNLPLALLLILQLGLAGCSSPGFYTNIGIGRGGVTFTVTPVAKAGVGGTTVSVRP